jgi:hypothetical protein
LQPGVVKGFLRQHHAFRRNVEGEWLRRRDFVVDVDLVEHRETDDAALVLSYGAVPETRGLERDAVAEIETMVDRRLEPIQVGQCLFEPAKCLAETCIDLLEVLDVLQRGRLPRRFVLSTQLVEQ